MKYKLISQPDKAKSVLEQILLNRGLQEDIKEYIKPTVHSYELLGIKNLEKALKAIVSAIQGNKKGFLIVDCDCDGYTSAALFINYLYTLFPTWVLNNLTWWMHESKQHGLSDCIEEASKYDIVFCLDSSSNDFEYHKKLKQQNINIIVIDHHLAEVDANTYQDAIIINNQLSQYPNKELSGVGIVWQFCRYIDSKLNLRNAEEFLDLVALGNCADMMSMLSAETKTLIKEGFKEENIHNPFIEYMIDKNSFSLNKAEYKSYEESACTSMGAAFFIVPFINATTRSGTIDEKKMLFKSMLSFEAFEKIPEIKYGKDTGYDEYLVVQAVRVVQGVKRRQTKEEENGLAKLESRIISDDMLKHKMLLFLLKKDEIPAEIRGLIANKLMAKYQRPCAILTYKEDDSLPWEPVKPDTYEGSARGYTKTGIKSFKDVCEGFDTILYAAGHDNAFGLGINAEDSGKFLEYIDETLSNVSTESLYYVDYVFTEEDIDGDIIADIASMNDWWGQDLERSLVVIKFKVTNNNFMIMKNNTLKFTLKNISIIKFGGTEEEIDKFTTQGFIEVEAICECVLNEWNGNFNPQLIMKDYNIIDSAKYFF